MHTYLDAGFYILITVVGAIQPETKKRPLEEMNYLFTNAPLFIPTMDMRDFETHDLEHRAAEVERKEREMGQAE